MTDRYRPPVEVVAEIAGVHDRRSQVSPLEIVPVIIEPGSPVKQLLQTLTETLSGEWLEPDAAGISDAIISPGLPAGVVPMLQEAFKIVGRVPARTLAITSLLDDTYEVSFSELKSPDAAGDAERHILALVRTLMAPALFSAEFAVVHYSETALDTAFRRAAWSVIPQLRVTPPPGLKTLVILVESTGINVPLHCQPRDGFLLAHIGQRELMRNPVENLDKHATALARHGVAPIVLFLGAGSSATSGLPLGNKLRDDAIRRMLGISAGTVHTSQGLAEKFYQAHSQHLTAPERVMSLEAFGQQLTFERVIAVEKHTAPELPTLVELATLERDLIDTPGPAVRALHQIIRSGRKIVLATVNLDRFIEHDVADLVRVFASDSDFVDAPQYLDDYLRGSATKVPVLKLHGTIDNLETCVVTSGQTETGLSDPKLNALRKLIGEPQQRMTWVYVGASMRDKDLDQFFHTAEFARGTDEYWVNPHLIDSIEIFAAPRAPYWQDRPYPDLKSRLVTETADTFLEALARRW